MAEIYISHSRCGEPQLKWLLSLFDHIEVQAICKQFDDYHIPPWPEISSDMERAKAVFLLLTPEVESTSYAANAVHFEAIKAVSLNKPLWIFEEIENLTTFPILGTHPSLTRYVPYSRYWPDTDGYIQQIICGYEDPISMDLLPVASTSTLIAEASDFPKQRPVVMQATTAGEKAGFLGSLPQPPKGLVIRCPYSHCGAQFELHTWMDRFTCPSCRQGIQVPSNNILGDQPCFQSHHYYY